MQTRRVNDPRLDANENIFLARELEALDPQNYFVLFQALLGRRFVPTIEGIPSWAEEYAYNMYEEKSRSKIGAPGGHAKDAPTVSIVKKKYNRTIKQIPNAYSWTVDEIKAAHAKGIPLDTMTAQIAMAAIAREIDTLIAFGDDASDITGLLNNASVDATTSPVTKTGGGTVWSDASLPAEWIADINKLVAATRTRLKQAAQFPGGTGMPAFAKFVLLLPQSHYTKLAETPRSTTSDTTALRWLLANNPFIESIEEWAACDTADSGTDPRIVCYPRDPLALGAVVPSEFESLSPQMSGHDVVVPCAGKCGGTVIRYPVAFSYMDDV